MFECYVSIIVLAGTFHDDFEELFNTLKAKNQKWTSVRKEANQTARDILKKKIEKLKKVKKCTDENKQQIRSMIAFSKIFKRFFTTNKF